MIQKRSHQVLALIGVNLIALAASANVPTTTQANDSGQTAHSATAPTGAQRTWIQVPQGHKGRTMPAPAFTALQEQQSAAVQAIYQSFAV
jgi:hypothetical protein